MLFFPGSSQPTGSYNYRAGCPVCGFRGMWEGHIPMCLWCSGQLSLNWDLGCHCRQLIRFRSRFFPSNIYSVCDGFCSFIRKKPQSWKYGNTISECMFFCFCRKDHIPGSRGKTVTRNICMYLKETELSSDFKLHWILSHRISEDAEGGCSFGMESKTSKCLSNRQNGELLFENWKAWYAY